MDTTATSIDLAPDRAPARPYARSWPNALATWLEGLPGPTWLAYAIGIGLSIGLSTLQQLVAGVEIAGGAFALVYYAALPFGVLGLMHALDRTAGRAIASLRPLLDADDAEIGALRYELTVAPARPAAILTAIGFLTTVVGWAADPAQIEGYTPLAILFRFVWESVISSVLLVLLYHTLRQLRLISRLHAGIARVDVFDQGPAYAFSQVTSLTSAGLLLLLAPGVLLLPADADVTYLALTLAWYVFAVAIAAVAFAVPLRGMHDRLADEKRRLQGEIGRRLSATVVSIHAAVDAGDGEAIEAGNRALSTLVAERELVNGIPTWPWSTGALTGFLSAVLLPLVLFLVQRFLGDALGG